MPVASVKLMSLLAKVACGGGDNVTPYCFRMLADRRMHGAGEAMEESRLDATGREQLAHVFQRIDGVLRRLRGEAVHQVGVHQDAGVGERARDARHLLDRHAFLHQLEQAIRRHFQSAGDGDAAAVGQQLAQTGIEGLLEADVAPPRDIQLPLQQCRSPAT